MTIFLRLNVFFREVFYGQFNYLYILDVILVWLLQIPFRIRLGDGLRDGPGALRLRSLTSGHLHIRCHCACHNRRMLQALGIAFFFPLVLQKTASRHTQNACIDIRACI